MVQLFDEGWMVTAGMENAQTKVHARLARVRVALAAKPIAPKLGKVSEGVLSPRRLLSSALFIYEILSI